MLPSSSCISPCVHKFKSKWGCRICVACVTLQVLGFSLPLLWLLSTSQEDMVLQCACAQPFVSESAVLLCLADPPYPQLPSLSTPRPPPSPSPSPPVSFTHAILLVCALFHAHDTAYRRLGRWRPAASDGVRRLWWLFTCAGMNLFLKNLQITFRRDPTNYRPRINKKNSTKDQEQKAAGSYYYLDD